MNYLKNIMIGALAAVAFCGTSCKDEIPMKYPNKYVPIDLPEIENIHTYNAPLYWSVYETMLENEMAGVANADQNITLERWEEIMSWIEQELLPHGYDMVCTDGWAPLNANDGSGYMSHYGQVAIADIVELAKKHGLRVGIYDNPLWIHGDLNTVIEGTNFPFRTLMWNGTSTVVNPNKSDLWFWWVVADYNGAAEYIDGFFKHFKELGVEMIRMDFLSWYEDGNDRGVGNVGRGYGRENYAKALHAIAVAAQKYGIFTSLVMPHLFNDAELEAKYGNMVRIVADTMGGGWHHVSEDYRGYKFASWPNCQNQMDGFALWNHIAGKNKVILDGDFIRLNKTDSDDECESSIALPLMAGGPIAITDRPENIGDKIRFYQNDELLALNKDRFVGHTIDGDFTANRNQQRWYGQMSDGSWVVGLFNRDSSTKTIEVNFSEIGLSGSYNARDLWRHKDVGTVSGKISASIPGHGCYVVKLTK